MQSSIAPLRTWNDTLDKERSHVLPRMRLSWITEFHPAHFLAPLSFSSLLCAIHLVEMLISTWHERCSQCTGVQRASLIRHIVWPYSPYLISVLSLYDVLWPAQSACLFTAGLYSCSRAWPQLNESKVSYFSSHTRTPIVLIECVQIKADAIFFRQEPRLCSDNFAIIGNTKHCCETCFSGCRPTS